MDEEFQKRNTDCVYFLASPLTCKKGSECEFRHSEMARLNPRDCWYWLSGSCLNPSCAFRHPPLDGGHTETSSETTPNVSAVPVNKINAPCYYFYNGFCNKGELCTFLHGPMPTNPVPAQKSSNPDAPPVEKKVSAGSDAVSAPSPPKFVKQSASPYKDAPVSPVAAASPGFDVLVDNGSEEVVYEDDYNYVVDHDGDSGYDFKENGRDDSRIFYEKDGRDYDYHFGGLSLDRVKDDPPPSSRRSVLDRVVHQSVDLRDRLKRRRMNDERTQYQVEHRRHEGRFTRSSFDRSRIQEKPQLSSKVSRKRGYDVESTVFRPPKTLSQIKDEKRTRGSRETSLSSLDGLPEDNFAAPKTLSEILEEKRRSGSLMNGNGDSS